MMIFWLVLTILCVVVEIVTVGLVSVWFAGGSLVACLLAMAGVGEIVQVITFLVVSFLLLIVTRPFAAQFINSNRTKTNYERLVGETVRITQRVENLCDSGTAVVNGQEWTARSSDDNVVLEAGELADIVGISGVKLIVKKHI